MKKVLCFLAILWGALVLSACAGDGSNPPEAIDASSTQNETDITLWAFPVGNWGNPTEVASLLSAFHKKNPDINISVEFLTYEDGDEKIENAIANGNAPDLVLEGPERMVADWGDRGLMVDLSELWDSDKAGTIYENVKKACQHNNGAYYQFPICMTAHCMAINYDMFKEAGALKYIDEETHTWTTKDFIKAVKALEAHGNKRAGVIYCKNQSGDQGTRALVNNLYGGTFTDDKHTTYTIDSEENIKALKLLYDLKGITFEPSLSSGDAIDLFCKKEVAMSFCWNVAIEIQQTINNPDLDFEVFPMAFPTASGEPKLQGGIWGFGIFDNGDEKRVEAAKTFVQQMSEDEQLYTRSVWTSTYWPVRDMGNLYENDVSMTEYSVFMPYMGDYYQITPQWAEARAAWWQMLQKIGDGTDAAEATKGFPAVN